MAAKWTNWAREQHCEPAAIERPRTREELIRAVAGAAERRLSVRAVGSGHSFTDAACTEGLMLRLDTLDRVLDVDAATGLVRIEAGIVLGDLNRRLDEAGRAFENLGDIDRQTLAGSISTGTHGTGIRFQSISAQVHAVESVLADGSVVEISEASDPEGLRAARLGLGALGVIYAVTIRTVPSYTIHRVDRPRPLAETLERLDELAAKNDHFEFYVFPRTEIALCRESRRTDEPPRPPSRVSTYLREVMIENWGGAAFAALARRVPALIPRLTRMAAESVDVRVKVDRSHRVFASERRLRFTEMEYAIPRERAREAVERVLAVANRWELRVAFPIEVRFAAADDAFLSSSYGRESCYIAIHQDRKLAWEPYFRAVEEIMREYEGRPHWGKRHFLTAEELQPLYPEWDKFQAVRARLDPSGAFRNAYTDRVLGIPRSQAAS